MLKGPPPKRQAQGPRPEDPEVLGADHKILPEVYYGNQIFWLRNRDGTFVATNTDVVRRRLKRRGFSGESTKSLNSEIDNILDDVLEEKSVGYVGALAGYDVGPYMMNGKRILVTDAPTIIQGNPDYENDFCHAYIERLLGEEASFFHGWIKLAREALLTKSFRTGQVLVIAGQRNHGKSFLAQQVEKMLGGRTADPEQYLTGQTQFNSHLFTSELLLMDDKGGHDDYQTRRAMADGLKQLITGAVKQCHAKGQTPLTLCPFWRVLVIVNDDPEPLQVLPPLEAVGDKMLIVRTVGHAIDRDTSGADNYAQVMADFEAGIPDYLGWLDQWELPPECLGTDPKERGRFGMVSYHNPEIEEMLKRFTPEEKLAHMIEEAVQGDTYLTLTAREIENMLKAPGISPVEREAGTLLRAPGACQKYLARICKAYPHIAKHEHRSSKGYAQYGIFPRIADPKRPKR